MKSTASSRPYRKRKRAQSEEETRRRITEAAVELHGSVGPARTKLTEIARLAGVSRMTVYNHFPTDTDLFTACSTHWAAQNPFPDPAEWAAVVDPTERVGVALGELYEWYGSNHEMLGNVIRDAPLIPAVAEIMGPLWGSYMTDIVDALALGWTIADKDRNALHAALQVAIDFHTWQGLTGAGMPHGDAAALAADMVIGAFRLRAD